MPQASRGRDQLADDHVLLQAHEAVARPGAASVSTLVVSWKEAAERNDSVASEALVIPRITGSARAGVFVFLPLNFSLMSKVSLSSRKLAVQQIRRAL